MINYIYFLELVEFLQRKYTLIISMVYVLHEIWTTECIFLFPGRLYVQILLVATVRYRYTNVKKVCAECVPSPVPV